ncbi:hypothetical protein BH23VER1_BH23VER1_23290 [soil metagenome]
MKIPLCAGFAVLLGACSERAPDRSATPDSGPEATAAEPGLAIHPAAADRRFDAAIHDIVLREDPVVDGWDSERFTEVALAQLKKVGEILGGQSATSDGVLAAGFSAAPVRPGDLELVFHDASVEVKRPRPNVSDSVSSRLPSPIVDGLADIRTKFKIVRVDLDGQEASTTAYFQMSGTQPDSRTIQINATWHCQWMADDPPLLAAIEVADYEEVVSSAGFVDCTGAAIAGAGHLTEQFAHGRDHWYGSMEVTLGIDGRGNGIAIGDANGDGLEDIYLCQPAALPNRLLLRAPDGSLSDASAAAGVDWLDSTRAALLIDIDNDGDQDLVLSMGTHLVLHENDGTGHFRVRLTIPSSSTLFSISAVDYDGDGHLDLYACGYSAAARSRPEDIFASPMPYHDANNGGPNMLLRNEGNWEFTDVTREVGLDTNNLRFSLAAAWEDFDNDGDPDLYVANDFGRNNLYRNDGGTFTDIAAEAGLEDIGPGMSVSWGDANNDGHPDLYVSNMFSSAGSRITRQKQFKPGADPADIAGFQRHARGNSLFINRGDGTFDDRSTESGTSMGRWAWGSLFVDLNNDGHRDLYVTNGFVTADNKDDL